MKYLITGGSSGIGKSIALKMANNDAEFYITGRHRDRLDQTVQDLEEKGATAYYGIGDVGNPRIVDHQFEDLLKKLGSVDVVVLSAGVGHFGPLEELTINQYDSQFDTNVKGVFLWLRKVIPLMKEQNSGQIIVISSNLGLHTSARASLYAASKHAVQAMVSSLRKELQGTMVKAATLNPGSVNTPWFDGKDVNREKMLDVDDVAQAAQVIIEQSETSNIDHILLLPGKR